MESYSKSVESFYDERYRHGEYFTYREWLYRPFVRALIRKARLAKGASVLDIGCGQGFFSWCFANLGCKPLGVDISAEAIRSAKDKYGSAGGRFETGEVLSLPYHGQFDSVFVRGFSLHNSKEFKQNRSVTDALLRYLKPDGVLIFVYCSNFSPRKKSEMYIRHSLSDARAHFSSYSGAKVYFSLRAETLLFGSFAFCFPFTFLSSLMSRATGIGGDLIAFVPRAALKE